MALIHHYRLEEDGRDSIGGLHLEDFNYNNNPNSGGDLTYSVGKIGNCLERQFGATGNTNANKRLRSTSKILLDGSVSYSAWVRVGETQSSSICGVVNVFNHTISAGITLYVTSLAPAMAFGLGSTRPSYSSPVKIQSETWAHIVATYDRTTGIGKLYVDGQLTRTTPSITVNVDSLFVEVGSWSTSYSEYGGQCRIDDVRIYDHALSDKEVKELAKAKVLHYKFDEQDLTTKIVKDCSGFGNDGTVVDATAPSWSEDSPVGRGSMEFDESLITTGKIFYDKEQAHTVSAWVKPTNIGIGTQNLLNFHSGYTLSRGDNGRTLMYMNSGTNDHYVYGNSLEENKWTHVTWVYDKSSLRCQVYYDGVLHASSTNFTVSDVPSGFHDTTIFGSNFVGNISDIRIYATALPPEDILEIYQTRASIDNMGNLHAYESDEVSEDTTGISSQGIAKFTSINEVGRPVRYIRDWLNGSTSNSNNHWVEIQAIDPSGTNVALGKSSPSVLITDGSTASNPYYSAGSGLKSVTVDLGDAHNITYLHIWHYWSDKRTYHNTKTEISTDGTNWVTVFDSTVEGEYAESSEGKKILLYPDKVSIDSGGSIYTKEILEN